MNIAKLKIQNALGIKCFEASDLQNVVKISGKNGAGKSRILTSIMAALCYGSIDKDKRDALLKTDGDIEIELSGKDGVSWNIARTIKNGKTTLKVKSSDGRKGNQSTLNDFIGDNFVDLGKFISMPNDKKQSAIMEMVGLSGPLDELEARHGRLYEERRSIGQQQKSIGLSGVAPEKIERVDVSKVYKQKKEADENNNRINEEASLLDRTNSEIAELTSKIASLKDQADAIRSFLSEKAIIDTTKYEQQIQSSTEINRQAEAYESYLAKKKQHDDLQKQYDQYTNQINNCNHEKQTIIEQANFPIDGMGYSEGKITFNGHPLISDGQYRSVAFQIAKTLKSDLNVATFENFSLLDPDAQASVIQDAKDAGFQAFVEIVSGGPSDEDAFYIEDGQLINEAQPVLA